MKTKFNRYIEKLQDQITLKLDIYFSKFFDDLVLYFFDVTVEF